MKAMKRKWGCYEDYAQELDNEGRERRHDAGECDGVPLCAICVEERLSSRGKEPNEKDQLKGCVTLDKGGV